MKTILLFMLIAFCSLQNVHAQQKASGTASRSKTNIAINYRGAVNDPLIILNGKEVDQFMDIDPADIDNITILKNSASVAQYGEKGRYGIILITTKQGAEQQKNSSNLKEKQLTGSNEPIYIVDEQMVTNIEQLEPNKIKDITILKNASAVAQYGDIGKNGVVIINTKKGNQN